MNFVDLFCGCGGLSEGFLAEVFEPLFLADNDKYAMETTSNRLYQSGFGNEKVKSICHVSDLTQNDSLKLFKSKVTDHPDTILAGIPCQAYSTVGRAQDKHSMRNDKRNYLYISLMNYIKAVMPKTVIIENVSGLLSAKPKNNKNILDEIFKSLNSLGYLTYNDRNEIVLNSVNFGVPQERKRVIIFGVHKSLGLNPEDFFINLVKKSFNQRRKMLLNSLSKSFDSKVLKESLGELDISLKSRAEDLSPENFLALANILYNKK